MRQTVYKITMSDGLRVDVDANSAGEAIEKALRENLGRRVAACYSGMTEEDARDARISRDKLALAGMTTHEIPPHVPYQTAPAARPRRLPDRAGCQTKPSQCSRILSRRRKRRLKSAEINRQPTTQSST